VLLWLKKNDSGLAAELLETCIDPNFIPDPTDVYEPNEYDHSWSFSLLNVHMEHIGDVSEGHDSEEDVEVQHGKRKEHEDDFEKVDCIEACATQGTRHACEFWAGILSSVILFLLTINMYTVLMFPRMASIISQCCQGRHGPPSAAPARPQCS